MSFIFINDINLKRKAGKCSYCVQEEVTFRTIDYQRSPGLIPRSDSVLINSDLKDRAAHVNYLYGLCLCVYSDFLDFKALSEAD